MTEVLPPHAPPEAQRCGERHLLKAVELLIGQVQLPVAAAEPLTGQARLPVAAVEPLTDPAQLHEAAVRSTGPAAQPEERKLRRQEAQPLAAAAERPAGVQAAVRRAPAVDN